MKKQVYKVGDRVKIIHCESGESFLKRHNGQIGVIKHIWIEGYRKGWVSLLLPNNECCIASKVSPLKPKRSIKKESYVFTKVPKALVDENLLIEYTTELAEKIAIGVETRISMAIRPKPKWMPKPLWSWLIRTFLNIEIVNKFK